MVTVKKGICKRAEIIIRHSKQLNILNRLDRIKEERLILIPTAQFVVKEMDILILPGANDGLERLREKVS